MLVKIMDNYRFRSATWN